MKSFLEWFPKRMLLAALVLGWGSSVGIGADASSALSGKPKLILSAATANEIDDLYAIVRVLRQDQFEVLGIASAQWFHYLAPANTVQASQQLNEELVKLLGWPTLPTPMGVPEPTGRPWGGEEPKDSAAARFIIESALALPPGEKLYVVCIGASTELASAIKLKPEIAPRIKACVLGCHYDRPRGAWNKSEFNVRRDLNAATHPKAKNQ